MRKHKLYKVSRGALEEQRLREDNRTETQRALLFILPVLMVAVLVLGLYFGYQTYRHTFVTSSTVSSAGTAGDEDRDPMLLSVVSSASPLEQDYVPTLSTVRGVEVSAYAADMLERMLTDADSDGVELILREGYISFAEEKERYDAAVAAYKKSSKSSTVKAESYVKRTIPKEGESEQQTGLIVYLDADSDADSDAFESTPAFSWLLKNASDYGFVLRYPEQENVGGIRYTPHLFRYVEVEDAYFIRAYDMSFDEYVAYIEAK